MPVPTETELNASFFDTVHILLEQDEAKQQAERRIEPRRMYQRLQLMAPVIGDKLPSQAEFRQVECYDISCRGFSYLEPDPPTYDTLVVALGEIPFSFLLARVMGFGQVRRDRRFDYRIGCQFTRRLNP